MEKFNGRNADMKKLTALLCAFTLLLTLASFFTACNHDKPSEGLEFQLNPGGASYSVIGLGTCKDSRIVVPSTYEELPVTEIGAAAFYDTSIKSVVLPEGITSIEAWAFEKCKKLTSVVLPEGLTSIGYGAFYTCDKIKSLKIPSTVKNIDGKAFASCGGLTEILLPDSVTTIGDGAFSDCYNVKKLIFGQNLKSIGSGAFRSCWSIRNVTVTGSVPRIPPNAFEDCRALVNLTIPRSVVNIADSALRGCESLTTLTYSGKKSDFLRILREPNWKAESALKEVVCSDGVILLPET